MTWDPASRSVCLAFVYQVGQPVASSFKRV